MREVYIQNLTKTKFDLKFFKNVAKRICRIKKIKRKEIGIILVDDEKIQRYNLGYRGANRATDVLAFPIDEKTGEILISLESARRQAKIYHQSLKKELSLLIIHGLLHLAGYEDTDRGSRSIMRKEEEKMLSLLQ